MPPRSIPYAPYVASGAREHLKSFERSSAPTVDIHGHMKIDAAEELVKPHLPSEGTAAHQFAPAKTREINSKQNAERNSGLIGIEERLAEMDKMQVDIMAVSPWPPQLFYPVDASLGLESAQIVNDGIAKQISAKPDRLVGLGTVPLQSTDNAIKELDRLMNELKFKGIEIAARLGDEELSADRLDPFWERCEHHDIPIFIHPTSFASSRFGAHYLTNIIGNPLDTTVAVHYLIFDGVLERFPNLKFVLSHGGAFAAAYAGRMDHAYGARPDCRERISAPPSHYLAKFYPDSVVFTVDQLDYLTKKFGPDHILIGTDYPFDMGEYDPVEHVYQVPGLSQADRDKICGLNALRLMKMDPADYSR